MSTSPEHERAPAADTLPDREARNPFLRYLLHLGLPTVLSLVVHAGLFGFLGFKTFAVMAREPIQVGEYEARLTESLADQMQNAFSWSDPAALETPDELAPEPSLEALISPQDFSTDFSASDLDTPALGGGIDDGSGLGIGDGALTLLGTGSGAAESGRGGFGAGFGSGGSRIGQAGVWNLRIVADKIVYVVDFSGSIIVAVDDLKRELKRSIGQLNPSQSFNVIIFYSSGGGVDERVQTESFRSKLEPATEDNRRAFFTWIDRKAPRGVTEPLEAMRRALALDPEAVFLFSDGFFDDSIVGEITRANRRTRAMVCCLVFDEQLLEDTSGLAPRETDGSRRLQRIAEANDGKFKIVTGKDLGR